MTSKFDEAVWHLKTQFVTAGPYYLSDYYKPNGDKDLYEFLLQCYRTEFPENFRILVVQDQEDVYDYQDLPGRAIMALQKYASQIDISNFFIVIVTNNVDIENELKIVQKLYSTDAHPLQSYVITGLDYEPTKPLPQDTFCVLPWMHLYIGTDGNVLPCCHADHQFPLGNVTEQDINSIIRSPAADQLRKNLYEGQRSKECKRCYDQEDAGLISNRMRHNQRWIEIKKDNCLSDGTIIDWRPVYLDIRLNNICNLKCRMCSGYFSSAIAQEEVELFGSKSSVESSLNSQQRKKNLEKIIEYLPTAEKIYFAGGEPLLSLEHYEILDALVACKNTNLEVIYNTNFTTLTYKNRSVLELWKKFSNVTLGASLDAQGGVAEYVRHGTKWCEIEQNFSLLRAICPHVNFQVTSTVGLLNVSSLISLQKDWHQQEKLHISKFSMIAMISPDHLTLPALPKPHKQRLDHEIQNHIRWCRSNGAPQLASQWEDMLSYMWSKDSSHAMTEFKRLTNIMDKHRHQSLISVIPEYQNLT